LRSSNIQRERLPMVRLTRQFIAHYFRELLVL
jgi:hypothetical protein